jgi:hypothetical protein
MKDKTNLTMVVPEKDKKMVKLEPHVHNELSKIGFKGESYSQIIERLIKEHKEREKRQ